MERRIDLNESLNSAIEKMENAKNAYEWLKRHEETSDTQEQTKQFDIFKEINTVPDILLRCFAIEKKIPCYKTFYDGDKNFMTQLIDVQNLETKAYAYNVCSSILYYNSQNPDKAYLEDVDFASFFDDSKDVRNLNTHVGMRGVLQDVYRVFANLNKILLALDCNKERITVSLSGEAESEQFDFERFQKCMDDMNTDERKFILISDSLHDVSREELSSFLSIPWSLIIDYDGTSSYGGLQSALTEGGVPYNKYLEDEFTQNNSITYMPGRVMYIGLCDDTDFRKGFRARGKKSRPGERDWIANAVNKVRNTRNRGTVVVVGVQNNRMKDIINYIAEEFREIDVIYLVRQDGELVEKTDDEDWGNTGNISSVITFDHSIFEVMRRIHANRNSLPQRDNLILSDNGPVYRVCVPGIGKIGINDRDQIQKVEQYFEFVHLDIGKDVTENNEWNFFHGDSASWAAIRYGDLPILSNKKDRFINTIRNGGYNKCYCVYHSPGIGGSTLGRQLAWELKDDMPVLVAKKYNTSQIFKACLHDLYIHLFEKNPFILMVDEDLFSDSEMQDIEMAISSSDYRVNALFIKRISEAEAKQHYRNASDRELLFTRLEPEEKDRLKSRCFALLQGKGQEFKYEDRVKALEETIDEKERYALLINLYLLEEDFKLETYVERFLKQIPKDVDGRRMEDLLAFTAIGAYFSNNVKIPVSYYSEYLLFGQRNDYINDSRKRSSVEKLFKVYEEGLLLKISDQGNKWYGIKHYLIAQEMLRQLLGGSECWQSLLPDYSRKLIDMLVSLSMGHREIDEVVKNIITALFTDKTRDREQRLNSDFTALLDYMDEPTRIDIILYLADCFGKIIKDNIPVGCKKQEYRLLAHIYAQCARIRSKCLRITENSINEDEVDFWIRETVNLIYVEKIYEYDLEDMLGRCYLDRIKRADNDELNDENISGVLKNVDAAITHFSNTVGYGSANYGIPGKLESIWRGIKIIKKWRGWGEDRLIEHLYGDETAKDYLEKGQELIREVDEYEMTTQGRVRMLREKENFEQTCSPLEPSKLIENLENLRKGLDPKDYDSQYIVSSGMVNGYERKYYKVSNEYRRSQLIHEALKGDKDAKNDAKRVFEHLDLLVKLANTNDVSYTTYKCWFEYAKYLEVPLTRAWDVALLWKNQELKRVRDNLYYESNLLLPYYYLYVITLLRYMSGQGTTESDVRERKKDLNEQIKATSRNTSTVKDWLATGKGMGQLYDRSWINLADVDAEPLIRIVRGKVIYYENNWGYLKLTDPRVMGSWGKAPIGQRYSKDCDVFFDGRQSGIISEVDVGNGQNKEFKVGFSYEGLVASTKSLERNIKKTTVIEEGEQESLGQEITRKTIYASEVSKSIGGGNKNKSSVYCEFYPEYISRPKTGSHVYLNGTLSNGMKGGLSSSDIDLFGDARVGFGSSEDIFNMLKELSHFKVMIVDSKDPQRYKLSLFHTGIHLDEIMRKKAATEIKETDPVVKVDISNHEQDIAELPDITGKVTLYNFDFSKTNSVRGIFKYQGVEYEGIIIGVSGKMMKYCKKQSKIQAKVISKNKDQYILKI